MVDFQLDEIKKLHARVRDEYALIQHRLSIEQRQSFRRRIAQLTSLVWTAENEAKKNTELDIQLAVARAKDRAPKIAEAVLASSVVSPPKSDKSAFSFLGDIFKLK